MQSNELTVPIKGDVMMNNGLPKYFFYIFLGMKQKIKFIKKEKEKKIKPRLKFFKQKTEYLKIYSHRETFSKFELETQLFFQSNDTLRMEQILILTTYVCRFSRFMILSYSVLIKKQFISFIRNN